MKDHGGQFVVDILNGVCVESGIEIFLSELNVALKIDGILDLFLVLIDSIELDYKHLGRLCDVFKPEFLFSTVSAGSDVILVCEKSLNSLIDVGNLVSWTELNE